MPKTLTQRYEELNAEIERLNALYEDISKREDKAWENCLRWEKRAKNASADSHRCEEALRAVVAKREAIVTRLMKGKAEKWLPPEKVAVAVFEEWA